MGCSFLAPVQSALGAVANTVAPIVASIPGPWQLPAMAYNVYNAASQGNIAGAVMAAIPGIPIVSQAGGIGNAISNSVNGISNIASGISNGAGVVSSIANAAGSAYNAAAAISQITAAAPGIDAAAAANWANAGYSPADIATMSANGMSVADMNALGSTLPGLASGATTSVSGLSQKAQTFLNSSTGTQFLGRGISSLAQGGAAALAGYSNSQSANQAAQIQAQSSANALAETKRQFDIGQVNQQPWLTAGKAAQGAQLDLMGLPGGTLGTATNALTELQKSPGYQFQLQQGQKSLDAGLAARGGMGSGKALTAGVDYNQNMASTNYNNRLSQLSSVSNMGQAAASGMAGQGASYANTAGALTQNIGNAQATGVLASNQAQMQGIQGIANSLSSYANPTPKIIGYNPDGTPIYG